MVVSAPPAAASSFSIPGCRRVSRRQACLEQACTGGHKATGRCSARASVTGTGIGLCGPVRLHQLRNRLEDRSGRRVERRNPRLHGNRRIQSEQLPRVWKPGATQSRNAPLSIGVIQRKLAPLNWTVRGTNHSSSISLPKRVWKKLWQISRKLSLPNHYQSFRNKIPNITLKFRRNERELRKTLRKIQKLQINLPKVKKRTPNFEGSEENP